MGEVKTNIKDFGYMWECPDYFELEQKGVLLWSPQGLKPTGTKYQNIYQSGFVIGEFEELYFGLLRELTLALERGYYFSINHQVIGSSVGRKIIDAIPLEIESISFTYNLREQ